MVLGLQAGVKAQPAPGLPVAPEWEFGEIGFIKNLGLNE